VWDWGANTKTSFFANGNPERSSQICMLQPVEAGASLLVASTDGIVRVWGDIEETGCSGAGARPGSAATPRHCHRLAGIHQMAAGPGFEADWSEPDGTCYGLTSSAGTLLAWDVRRPGHLVPGPCLRAHPTCIRASRATPRTVYVGYADGAIGQYDLRTPSGQARLVGAHKGPLASIGECGQSEHLLISSTAGGELAIHDARWAGDAPLVTRFSLPVDAEEQQPHHGHHQQQRPRLTTFAVHPLLPVVAAGSGEPALRFLALSPGREARIVNTVRYREGLFGLRIGTPLCSAFHPRRPLYAAATDDAIIAIYRGC
jgi:WD40 repeat protein